MSTCPSSEVPEQKDAVKCRPVLEQAMQCFILPGVFGAGGVWNLEGRVMQFPGESLPLNVCLPDLFPFNFMLRLNMHAL